MGRRRVRGSVHRDQFFLFVERSSVVGPDGSVACRWVGQLFFSDSLQLKAPAGWGEPGSGEVVEGLRLVIPVL